MKTVQLFFSICILSLSLNAQNNEIQSPDINSKYTLNSQYLYDQFLRGKVYHKNGTENETMLNYNVLNDEIHFFKHSNVKAFETEKLSKVIIKGNVFVPYKKKIYEVIGGNKINIYINRKPELWVLNESPGAYGQSSVNNMRDYSIELGQALANLDLTLKAANFRKKSDKEIPVYNHFFFSEKNNTQNNEINNMQSLTRRRILKNFNNNKKEIKSYIKENNIDLKTIEDLKRLQTFIDNLP
ncbi:MAG: hypothetical protein R6V16_02555 [Bacteroidales bacterium]